MIIYILKSRFINLSAIHLTKLRLLFETWPQIKPAVTKKNLLPDTSVPQHDVMSSAVVWTDGMAHIFIAADLILVDKPSRFTLSSNKKHLISSFCFNNFLSQRKRVDMESLSP